VDEADVSPWPDADVSPWPDADVSPWPDAVTRSAGPLVSDDDELEVPYHLWGPDPGEPELVADPYWSEPRRIWSWHLRSMLTLLVHRAGGPVTVVELVRAVEAEGFVLRGRPGKTVSDALRGPLRHGWVRRVGRGRYAPGRMAKSTASRHRARVREARRFLDEQLAEAAGIADIGPDP
jgi:hypothetical protein